MLNYMDTKDQFCMNRARAAINFVGRALDIKIACGPFD
jgi:hypothetical protein